MGDNTVTVADLTLHDGPFVPYDGDGYKWILTRLGGWFDSPSPRADPLERPGADGDYDGNPTQDSRLVIVEGTVTAPDRVALQVAMDRVNAVLTGATRYGTLTVDEVARGMSRQAVVRLGGQTVVARTGPTTADLSFSLFAPDPRRYSSELHSVTVGRYMPGGGFSFPASFPIPFGTNGSDGTVTVTNAGTASTWPVLRFSGPSTNPYAKRVGDGTIAAGLTLVSGQELVVDCGLRSVLLGSASRRQFLTADDFFALPPGQSQIYFSADDGAGELTVEWRDAW